MPLTILIVEDEKACREVLYPLWLKPLTSRYPDTKLVLKETMTDAMQYLSMSAADLILLDMNLTDSLPEDTISRLPEILDKSKGAKIILVSGNPDSDLQEKGIKSGAAAFFSKERHDLVPFLLTQNLSYFEHMRATDDKLEQLDAIVRRQ